MNNTNKYTTDKNNTDDDSTDNVNIDNDTANKYTANKNNTDDNTTHNVTTDNDTANKYTTYKNSTDDSTINNGNNGNINTTDNDTTNKCNTNKDTTNKDTINKDTTNKDKFHFGEKYYFDKSGLPMLQCECPNIPSECEKLVETCCLIKIPRGFIITNCSPEMCFNLSELTCVKNPEIQTVNLPACGCSHPKQCEVVAGYEIRAVGVVDFSLSIPIHPISGACYKTHSHACCSSTAPVNEIISYTCCPNPCIANEPCVDWTYAYFSTILVEENCISYIKVKMGVALEYTGTCDCDEE